MDNLLGNLSVHDLFGVEQCLQKLSPAQLGRLNTLVQTHPILTEGDFYLRPTSQNGLDFALPVPSGEMAHNVVAWSRISDGQEVLCAVNTNQKNPSVLYVTVDNALHVVNSTMRCLYASDLSPAELNVEVRNGKSIRLSIPPHALVIFG
ncbi:hypothetical protein [Dyadobacter sp. CY323]|uniref:hypothetical protein n=1 Tax=Dyadobacter sp. CY323 TaxID=2907302 RepID=UPI001F18D400|nr:hypothetical protein [Dyadobacter sp. CY323]MCE6989586.1 hypothetical protein [Dyadobacter sp. CY323]